MSKPEVAIIAAIGKNRELGKDGRLLWHISDDLKRFKSLTMGHPIIMGRKTFESIGKPLPGRANIVVTRDENLPAQAGWSHEGAVVAHSLEEAIEKAKELDSDLPAQAGKIFVVGGSQIYGQALPYADKLYLTLIDDEKEADSFFPEYEHLFTQKTFEEKRFDEKTGLHYTWVDLVR